MSECSALVLLFSSDYVSFSFIFAHVEGKDEPVDVEEVQGIVTLDDFATPESANREQAAAAEDEEDCMPDGFTVDQSEIMFHKT